MKTPSRNLLRCLTLSLAFAVGCSKNQPPPAHPEAGQPTADAATEGPSAEEVLAEALAAAGGEEAVDKVQTSYSESKGTITAQGLTVATRTWTKGEDFYTESDMPGVGLTQTWKIGDKVWSKDPINGMRELKGDEAWQAQWSSDPLLLARWHDYFDQAKLGEGSDSTDDVVFVKGDKEVVMSFAKDTHLQSGMSFEQTSDLGKMPVSIEFTDHRDVDGMKIPFKTVMDMKVMKIESEVVKYEVNVDVDPDKFKPPVG